RNANAAVVVVAARDCAPFEPMSAATRPTSSGKFTSTRSGAAESAGLMWLATSSTPACTTAERFGRLASTSANILSRKLWTETASSTRTSLPTANTRTVFADARVGARARIVASTRDEAAGERTPVMSHVRWTLVKKKMAGVATRQRATPGNFGRSRSTSRTRTTVRCRGDATARRATCSAEPALAAGARRALSGAGECAHALLEVRELGALAGLELVELAA